MKNKNVVEISRKGQLLIPKYYRKTIGIKPGSKVSLSVIERSLVVRVLPEDPLEAGCGFLQGEPSLVEDLIKERHAEKERERKRVRP